jgi:hypothetical protein
MSEQPQASIPDRNDDWGQTLATYRLLNNSRVTPQAVQAPAIERTRQQCDERSVVLCVHDLTELKPVYRMSDTKLLQHTALAVDGDDGEVLGLLHQRWFDDPKKPKSESQSQRHQRWRRSQAWPQAVEAVGEASGSCRLINVADREADDFQMFDACDQMGHGFVIRSQHDRRLADGVHLCETVLQMPVAGHTTVAVARRSAVGVKAPPRKRRPARKPREANLAIRFGRVTLGTPMGDPRYTHPREVYVVHALEEQPPADGGEPIDWLLLTSEPVTTLADALRVLGWYCRRWLIEEFHKAQKTGCRLEESQLQAPDAFVTLAAIAAVVAVRLLNLRDQAESSERADEPAMRWFDSLWVLVVCKLAKHPDPSTLTVRQFYHTIAKKGGWLARRGDGRPGWQTLWRGWRKIAAYVTGIELVSPSLE